MNQVNFLIGGAPKCATTALADALRAHPDIHVPEKKELNFFGLSNWENGYDWYTGQFARARPDQRLGEATPWYMSSPLACEQIHARFPHMKFVFMLRNPVERAWSHYWYRKSLTRENRGVSESFARELSIPADQLHPRVHYLLHPGLYDTHIGMFEKWFPADNIHVVLMEDLKADKEKTIERIQEFIGVSTAKLAFNKENAASAPRSETINRLTTRLMFSDAPWKRAVRRLVSQHHRTRIATSLRLLHDGYNRKTSEKPVMPPAIRASTARYFQADVERLSARLGRDLSGWISEQP